MAALVPNVDYLALIQIKMLEPCLQLKTGQIKLNAYLDSSTMVSLALEPFNFNTFAIAL